MALKRVLETLDDLEDGIKPLYVERNGKFYLDAEDEPETAALRRAKDREAEAARKLREKLAETEATLAAKEEELAGGVKPNKKVDELEASWKQKLANEKTAWEKKFNDQQKFIENSLIENAAGEFASLFTVPTVGKKIVKERLAVEFGDEGPKLRILDAAGSPSAMSLDDLRKELVDNKEFAPIIVATNARGGGAGGAGQGGGGAGAKPFKDMNEAERVALYRTDPARFTRETAALKGI